MKNISKLGFIAIVAVIGFSMTSCLSLFGPPKWDKSVPKDQVATLYYTDEVRVVAIGGEEKGGNAGIGTSSIGYPYFTSLFDFYVLEYLKLKKRGVK